MKASDEEIESFFAETTFEGIFSREIKSKHTDYYKGSVSDIKLEGRPTSIVSQFLNVPTKAKTIPEGPCSFKCRINIDALHEDPQKYIVSLVGVTLHSIDSITKPVVSISAADSQEQELFEMWGVDSCEAIGYYHYDEETEVYVIDDLRKPNFDHIPYYPGDKDKRSIRFTFPRALGTLKTNQYYLLTWKLSHKNNFNPYEIVVDIPKRLKPIDPKWFIDKLFDDRHGDKSKNFGSAANFLDTLSKQLSAKESTFVYELLQNANDYPVEGKMVDVEFHITDNYLLFLHSGDKFNVRNISGICGINEKEKVANKKTIGYKGIGFKTVFLHNHYVYIQTGNYSFRFDEGETPEKKVGGKIKRIGAPFQILPIWTSHNEVAPEVNTVFDSSSRDFRVRIALRPEDKDLLHKGKDCYENLFKDIFADANIILFIPNINSVKVVINGKEERVCYRNNEEWVVGDYEENIPFELQDNINNTIDKGGSRIPEKYKDFDCTKVSFACKHEGAIIKPVTNSILYCYLPTTASWGLPFLMNTDMVPKGDRDDIEKEVKLIKDELNFNSELAAIAGAKLFSWVKDLLTSRKYHLGSVFSLIPDFKKCKREHAFYNDFLDKFEEAFDSCLEDNTIVPVSRGIAKVSQVILDTTGLSTSGIMTDDEFRKFTGMEEYYLPLSMLRNDKNFNSFLKRYADDDQKFTAEDISNLIANKDFKEWLKIQDNNNKFLNFLLEKEYLADHLDEKIFLEDEGSLQEAGNLYYDIDKYLVDLQAFTNYLYFLSPATRAFFKDNEKWNEVIDGAFAEFDCDHFVDYELLSTNNKRNTIEKLKDKDTSVHFFKFLAENVGYTDSYRSMPFFDDADNVCDDFEQDFIFFSSKEGHSVCESDWLSKVDTCFISDSYLPVTKTYFKDNFGVRDYEDKIIVENIILSSEYQDDVSDGINDDFAISKDFVNFCFKNKLLINDGGLSSYKLKVFDCAGDENWYFAEGDTFFDSSIVDYYSEKEWIDDDWLVSVDDAYYKGCPDSNELKEFIGSAFGVLEMTDTLFYENIVKQNLSKIFGNISGTADVDGHKNIDFIKYLDDNYQLIFVTEKDTDIWGGLKLVTDNVNDVDVDEAYLYIYNDELSGITENTWFPDDTLSLCHRDYGNSKALSVLGVKSYKFSEFYDDVIVENIGAINDAITSKEESVSFHNFIIERLDSLTTSQQGKMIDAKVYLYGQDDPADNAGGHKTLSSSAKELFDLGLVEFSDMDLIDPDYKTEDNTEYWETRLGNTKFTINHFYVWLKDNVKTFCTTLEDESLNIVFWRWLKNNESDKFIDEAAELPVLLKDGTIDIDGPIYFSDEYMNGAGIEGIVKFFDKDAKFLSPKYIEENDDVEEWKTFFSKANIKCEIVDILVETVFRHLSEIDDENLPRLLAENREALEERYDNGLAAELTQLRVKAHDGNFYAINDTIYIDCEKDEPFTYIAIPNQISFKTADERRLIKDIIDEIGGDCVSLLSEWQQRKLDTYLELQDNDTDDIRDIHFEFINDLAKIRNNSRETLKELERIDEIQLLDKDNDFYDAATLTMGSVYNPFFDFELCEVESLDYVSDEYSVRCSEYAGRLFRELDVHCDFVEDDIDLLEDRKCAIYFWGKYLTKKDAAISRVKQFIVDDKFNYVACIPTKEYMKRPSELYYGSETSKYVKSIEDWENKVPLKELPDIKLSDDKTLFDLLPFKDSLDFLDALYALFNISSQERRTQLLKWMIDDYDESYDAKISEYREDEGALWNNNKNESIQIKDLYALDYFDKTLDQYFGTNPRIVNKAYFPAGDAFRKACDILCIKTITAEDLQMEPVGETVYTARDTDHKLYALVIAGMTDTESWKELYDGYCEKINKLVLHKCKSIMITYKEDNHINQSLKKFYHKNGENDFYFVDSLDGKRVFKSFVDEYISFLKIDTDDIAEDVIEDIMDSRENALEIVKEQNSLMLDEAFKDELDNLIPGIKRELSGNEANDDEEEDDGQTYRPKFTTSDTSSNDDEDNENYEEDDVESDNDDEINDGDEGYTYSGDDNSDDEDTSEDHTDTTSGTGTKTNRSGYSTGKRYSAENDNRHDDDNNDGAAHQHHERKHNTSSQRQRSAGNHEFADMNGWNDTSRRYTQSKPKPFSPEDVRNFGSHGVSRTLEVLEPTKAEVDEINRILGEDLSPEQIADQNYLAQLRLYNNLVMKGLTPDESKDDFIRNASMKNEHTVYGGKYIHKCSAAGGIMYLSPSIWNKIADDRCVVCVYLGAKANEFMYFNSLDEILEWIGEDDIVIKLTGEEKADVVEELYSGVLDGVKGTAYTLIRINSNEKYNSVFAPLATDPNNTEEDEDEYDE